jgi:hypothetical protein
MESPSGRSRNSHVARCHEIAAAVCIVHAEYGNVWKMRARPSVSRAKCGSLSIMNS